jgi:hypothetical protein
MQKGRETDRASPRWLNDEEEEPGETAEAKRQKRKRVLLFVLTCFFTTFYGGAFFGWGPMQLMLEDNGAFSSKCGSSDPFEEVCDAQTSSLLTVQMVAQLTLIFSPLLGQVGDKCGAAAVMHFLTFSGWTGIALLMVASALEIDGMLYPAQILIGCMAVATTILTVQTGILFMEPGRRRVISALNALYDAAALTYLILWYIQKAVDASLAAMLAGYLVLAGFVLGGASLLWCRVVPQEGDGVTKIGETNPGEDDVEAPEEANPGETRQDLLDNEEKGDQEEHIKCTEDAVGDPDPSSAVENLSDDSYVIIAKRPPKQQLLSKQYVLLSVFFSTMTARNIFTLTTARDFLGYLGDDEQGNKYLTIFTLMTPVSILGLPFIDQVLTRYGYHTGLQCINALALIHGTIQVSTENLNVQILGFVVFSFFRCFLFAVSFSFLPTFLGGKVIGKAAGLLVSLGGIVLFLNIPLANAAVNQLNGNFFWPNLFYTLIVIPNIFVVCFIGRCINREQEAARGLRESTASVITEE